MNTESARNVKEFVTITGRDDKDRAVKFQLPGHEGRAYEVNLSRANGHLGAICERREGAAAWDCQGNEHAVCYHVLAACEVAAEDASLELSWCNSQADAERLARIEGRTFCVESAQSGKRAWGVVRGHEPAIEQVNVTLANARRYVELLPAYYDNPRLAIEDEEHNALRLFFAVKGWNESMIRQHVVEHDPAAILARGRALLRGENVVEL